MSSTPEEALWRSSVFYKGYLPPAEFAKMRKWAVFAVEDENMQDFTRTPSHVPGTPPDASLSRRPELPLSPGLNPVSLGHSASNGSPSGYHVDVEPTLEKSMLSVRSPTEPGPPSSTIGLSSSVTHLDTRTRSLDSSCITPLATGAPLTFVVVNHDQVVPPPVKYMLPGRRCTVCLFLCNKPASQCDCARAHMPEASQVRERVLSVFEMKYLPVVSRAVVRVVDVKDIIPTAGFYYACGLLHYKIVKAVQPVLCRFNKSCRNGVRCLFIHTTLQTDLWEKLPTGEISLSEVVHNQDAKEEFVKFLSTQSLNTVSDIQKLSNAAFDSIVEHFNGGFHSKLWLNIASIRVIQPKMTLEPVLRMMPGLNDGKFVLPPSLMNVSNLIHMPAKEFYNLSLPPNVLDACERIRERFQPDRDYNIIDLNKEPKDSFFVTVTTIVTQFREVNAHVSWRKWDPKRPTVTSMMSYVDVSKCRCHQIPVDENDIANESLSMTIQSRIAKRRSTSREAASLTAVDFVNTSGHSGSFTMPPSTEVEPDFSVSPRGSWCTCPRKWEVAVNYELSTPSGSRCSEQNCLGKLAALGVPTYALREVFVHGENVVKDPNPLFPCGVCENMLRKVTKDVNSTYGGEVMLYMFDATVNPKRLVYLPITEISHRDGTSFKKFVAEDLRDIEI